MTEPWTEGFLLCAHRLCNARAGHADVLNFHTTSQPVDTIHQVWSDDTSTVSDAQSSPTKIPHRAILMVCMSQGHADIMQSSVSFPTHWPATSDWWVSQNRPCVQVSVLGPMSGICLEGASLVHSTSSTVDSVCTTADTHNHVSVQRRFLVHQSLWFWWFREPLSVQCSVVHSCALLEDGSATFHETIAVVLHWENRGMCS